MKFLQTLHKYRIKKMAEADVTLRKNKKIAILVLTPTPNLTQTPTLALTFIRYTLILNQAQNLTQTLTII